MATTTKQTDGQENICPEEMDPEQLKKKNKRDKNIGSGHDGVNKKPKKETRTHTADDHEEESQRSSLCKKKKKKKHTSDNEETTESQTSAPSKKQKKAKKRKHTSDDELENTESQENSPIKKQKKEKKKHISDENLAKDECQASTPIKEQRSGGLENNDASENVLKCKKTSGVEDCIENRKLKKKKKKRHSISNDESLENGKCEISNSSGMNVVEKSSLEPLQNIERRTKGKKSKKKKHGSTSEDGNTLTVEKDDCHDSRKCDEDLAKKSKKKNKKQRIDAMSEELNTVNQNGNVSLDKKEECHASGDEDFATQESIGKTKKSKKKKKHEAKQDSPEKEHFEDGDKSDDITVADKKSKRKKGETVCDSTNDKTNTDAEGSMKKKKKHKKSKNKDIVEPNPERKPSKAEKVKHTESVNTQEDTKSKSGLNQGLGQWGSADLGSSDRQNKFAKLLGGFRKTSSTAGTGDVKPVKKKFNMALNQTQQEGLYGALQTQFDQALDTRFSGTKSGGLGYQPPPGQGKKFHIDTSKTNSLKFED